MGGQKAQTHELMSGGFFVADNNDYEDLYATLMSLPRAPSPPAPGAPGPPLPPRPDTLRSLGSQTLALKALDSAIGKARLSATEHSLLTS